MENIKDLYILGESIDTAIGKCYFLKVKDYPLLYRYVPYLNLEKFEVINYFKQKDKDLATYLEQLQFIEIIHGTKEYNELYSMYCNLFNLCFKKEEIDVLDNLIGKIYEFIDILNNKNKSNLLKFDKLKDDLLIQLNAKPNIIEDTKFLMDKIIELNKEKEKISVFNKITNDEEFEYYRQLIRDMNCITYEKPNPNPEIAFFDKLEKIAKERHGEIVTLESMITSVGLYRHDVLELSIFQLYKYFDRLSYFNSYNATVLYRTITNEIDIIPWYKSETKITELTEEDKQYINANINKIKI